MEASNRNFDFILRGLVLLNVLIHSLACSLCVSSASPILVDHFNSLWYFKGKIVSLFRPTKPFL
jgi:hypothetical protein